MQKRNNRSEPQIGALPYLQGADRLRLVLVTSRRTGRWIFPKGGLEEGLSAAELVAREAFEEAGIEGEVGAEMLGIYPSIKYRGGESWTVDISLYPLKVTRLHNDWPERRQRRREIVDLDAARNLLSQPEMVAMAELLERRLVEDR